MVAIFEEPEQEHSSSDKLGQVFLRSMMAGIIGGLASLIRTTKRGGLVSVVTPVILIILTTKTLQNGS